jgi:hypothetical protein
MREHKQHVSDEDLLLAADGELGKGANCVRTHLEACTRCRTRAVELENALLEFEQVQKISLDADLPAIEMPRATLRARMADSGLKPGFFAGLFAAFRVGALGTLAVAAVLLACALAFQHSRAPRVFLSRLSSDREVLPNHAFTPGSVRQVSLDRVCSLPHEEVIKDVSPAERETVFAEYGISNAKWNQYEVDYLITPGLGGDDNIRNLWPEPYNTRKWNARAKDALEERLHEMVCSHQLDLSVAQAAIASNWIAAYEKYLPPATSTAQTTGPATLAMLAPLLTFTKDPASRRRLLEASASTRSEDLRWPPAPQTTLNIDAREPPR